jgi:ubiquinone biosynthesis UbiH/UbiF/VisC/COQ6 family hydroxylase
MKFDGAIVGGGVVGRSVARALAHSGLSLVLVEPRAARQLPSSGFDQRVYALNGRSRRFLERCEVWQALAAERIAPVREMLVYGDEASKLRFSAYRSGVPELASIVEETNLQQALQSALSAQANLKQLIEVECTGARWDDTSMVLHLSDGGRLEARLVVAADGADSALRAAAGIVSKVHEYGQKGVVANFHAQHAHRNIAHQWFLPTGVLALLPLPGDHVSMVWSAAEAQAQALLACGAQELARAVEQASSGTLGRLTPVSAAAAFSLRRLRAERLVGPRLALVGDTAHNVHPLAGQGLNLGLGDAEALAAALIARGMESDSGAPSLLRRFERSRWEDILAMEAVTDGLHLLFESKLPGARRLRNMGLRLTNHLFPLKRLLVKRALG